MSRTLAYLVLIVFAAMSIALVAARPDWVSDHNVFLKEFVGPQLLGLLGVILAITLASVASLHLEFNKIEERYGREGLRKSRTNIRKAARWLIALFAAAVALVSVKPLVCGGQVAEGLFNTAALLIVLWHVLILLSLTELVFAIPAAIKSEPENPPDV